VLDGSDGQKGRAVSDYNHASNRYRVEVVKIDDGYWEGYELRAFRDGELILAATDSGEPEDNMFLRDYAWIKPRLEEAYRLGFEDGASQNNPPEHVPSVTDMLAFGKVDEAFGDD
jgi:hypothetical protein